jgi:hypothetical protein
MSCSMNPRRSAAPSRDHHLGTLLQLENPYRAAASTMNELQHEQKALCCTVQVATKLAAMAPHQCKSLICLSVTGKSLLRG